MSTLLPRIASPADLHGLSDEQLTQLTQEMRDELVRVLSIRPAHFASVCSIRGSGMNHMTATATYKAQATHAFQNASPIAAA